MPARLGHVRGKECLRAGTVQVGRVGRGATEGDGDRVRQEVGVELTADGLGDPAGKIAVGTGDEHHDLAVVVARPVGEVDSRGHRAGGHAARAALDDRQHPRAPVALLRHLRVRSGNHHARTGGPASGVSTVSESSR